jgi:predicted SprT family Zn-dependent metalloprotease
VSSLHETSVLFGIRGTNGGTAEAGRNIIQLNLFLLNGHPDEFLKQVVPHEVCHLLCSCKFPMADAHGQEWKRLMRAFGLVPDRCHSMDARFVPTQIGRHRNPTARMVVRTSDGLERARHGGKLIDFDK